MAAAGRGPCAAPLSPVPYAIAPAIAVRYGSTSITISSIVAHPDGTCFMMVGIQSWSCESGNTAQTAKRNMQRGSWRESRNAKTGGGCNQPVPIKV
eukprot:5172094-Prymnesium_polylepis.1